jgi:hypothetical protein
MLTSMLLKAFPFHSFLQALAFAASRNFINTMYLLALVVRISRKWLTSSLVCSPMKPRRSEGVIYDGTASIHSVVQSSSLNSVPAPSSYNPGVSWPSRYKCTTPQPTSVFFSSEGMNLPLVASPPELPAGCLSDFARGLAEASSSLGCISMLSIEMVSKRQSFVAKL